MTLLEIEAFLAVVKYGSISTAAQSLYITQPALTRRIQLMEKELGYSLIRRQKGHRVAQLTEKGADFYRIAWKWQKLWEETNSIAANPREPLSVAAVGSVNHLLLSHIYPIFIEERHPLILFNVFSEDAYWQMARGLYDLAFIEYQDYTTKLPANVQSRPAFAESFFVVTFQPLPNEDGVISLDSLREEKEIYLLWNKALKSWHAEHFDERIPPHITIDITDLAGHFLQGDKWCFAPYTTAEYFRRRGAQVYTIRESNPPDQIIYYLVREDTKADLIGHFLDLLDKLIGTMSQDKIRSVRY